MRIAAGLYLAAWTAIATAVIYVLVRAGQPLWLALALASLLFIFVNGSLAYGVRARQLRREGKQPPRYLVYLFFPRGVQSEVALPRPIRIILGIPIALGGALLLVFSCLMPLSTKLSQVPHPLGAVVLPLLLASLGAAFMYVGYRLLVMQNDEPLLRPRRVAR